MGRITIFSIENCPFCIKAKDLFGSHNIPYVEINLSVNPDKRSDMLSISDSFSVPQVFFNDTHIGGATETLNILEKWRSEVDVEDHDTLLDRIEREVMLQEDPTDPRLAPSTLEPEVKPPPPLRNEDGIRIPISGEVISVLDVTRKLMEYINGCSHYRGMTVYRNSFRGCDGVKAIMEAFKVSTSAAEELSEVLLSRGIVVLIHGRDPGSEKSESSCIIGHSLYRLHPFQEPSVINSFRVWVDRVDPDYEEMLSRLQKLMSQIQSRATVSDGIDFITAADDPDFQRFEDEVCELQGVLIDRMDERTRTAFVINVYNLMIKHAQIKVGVAGSLLGRGCFFSSVKYNIGGELFSFNDLENGILRANAKPPFGKKVPFGHGDKRQRLALQKVDPRIHFALNCGASSCPPVKYFTSRSLDEELRIVAASFCEDKANVKMGKTIRTMHLSMIMKWYSIDFAPSISEVPLVLVKFMKNTDSIRQQLQSLADDNIRVKVKFNRYNWDCNSSRHKEFDYKSLVANHNVLNIFY